MMDFREQLEGGARFSRIRSLKKTVLGLQGFLVIVLALVILATSGLSVNPFYLPLNALLVPVLGYLLLLAGQNFAFRYLEIKHSKSDSHRYLIAKNSTSNAAWVIGFCVFALVVLLVVVQSGWATQSLSRESQEGTPTLVPARSTFVLVYDQDPFGLSQANRIETIVEGGGSIFMDVRDNSTRLPLIQGWTATGQDIHSLPIGGSRKVDIIYNNTRVALDTRVSWRLVVEPTPVLQLWVPVLLVGFIVSNTVWILFLRPKKAAYKAASIYSAEYAQKAEAGEETFQQYLDRTAEGPAPPPPAKPTIGAQVKPGVFTTDRPCPVCAEPLVWVQKYSRHYCLNCKAYRAATAPGGPAPPPPAPGLPEPPVPAAYIAPAPAAAPTVADRPPCPTCGRPLLWVEKHSRFYCVEEKKYAPKTLVGPVSPAEAPAGEPWVTPAPAVAVPTTRPVPAAKEPAPIVAIRNLTEEANAAYQLGDYRTAITLFDQAIAEDPKNLNAYLSKAAAQMKVGLRLEALATLDRAIFLDPKNERTLRVRALILEGEKRWNEAIDAYDAYLSVKPSDADFLVKKGDALLALGRRDEAAAQFEKALAVAPREQRIRARLDELKFDIAGVLSRALLASAGGNYSQAIALFDQVIVRDKGNLNALMGKAVALRRSGDTEGAHEVVRKVLTIAPKHPAALMTLGRILEDLGRSEEALNTYAEFLDVSPQDSEGWERQGDLLQKMGRTTEAVFAFQQALRTKPGDLRLLEKVKVLEPRLAAPEEAAKRRAAKKERPERDIEVPSPTVWAPPEKVPEELPSVQELVSEQPKETTPALPEPPIQAPETPPSSPPPTPEPAEPTKGEGIPREPQAPTTPVPTPVEKAAPEEPRQEPAPSPQESTPPPAEVPMAAGESRLPEAEPEAKAEALEERRIEETPQIREAAKTEASPEPEPEEVIVEREAEVLEEDTPRARRVPTRMDTAEDVTHEPTEEETDALKDALEQVKGVGPARLKALLKAGYTTVERVRAASEEELAEVKGLSRKVAKAIKESL